MAVRWVNLPLTFADEYASEPKSACLKGIEHMKVYPTEAIRNLSVIGHGDAGKTQLVSSLLYVAGATPRWGKVDEGTTATDYDEDSIARKITLNTALAHLDHRDTKLNFIDTPGYAAFVAHARPALRPSHAPKRADSPRP